MVGATQEQRSAPLGLIQTRDTRRSNPIETHNCSTWGILHEKVPLLWPMQATRGVHNYAAGYPLHALTPRPWPGTQGERKEKREYGTR
jgi:hypothetical protein